MPDENKIFSVVSGGITVFQRNQIAGYLAVIDAFVASGEIVQDVFVIIRGVFDGSTVLKPLVMILASPDVCRQYKGISRIGQICFGFVCFGLGSIVVIPENMIKILLLSFMIPEIDVIFVLPFKIPEVKTVMLKFKREIISIWSHFGTEVGNRAGHFVIVYLQGFGPQMCHIGKKLHHELISGDVVFRYINTPYILSG